MDIFGKEAARITGVVMAVLVALLTLFGIVLTPEDYTALGVIITAAVGVFITLGGAEFIRSKVASRRTVRKELGEEAAADIFGGSSEGMTQEKIAELEKELAEIRVYLEANK